MSKKVTLVEVNVFEDMVPLVSGYLQAYASADPGLRNEYEFEKYTTITKTSPATIVEELSQQRSDVYAFSCYLWNMGLVKKILPQMLEANPRADFLLGGPQVMHHADRYLDPAYERLVLCNGEGEKTFANYLTSLADEQSNLTKVRGLSFYREGSLITTEPEDRLRDLDEIPSPFLSGLFDDSYRMSILETNRGCPFRCGFCFWGAATNDKVVKFSENRIREKVTWIAKSGTPFLFIADANWGMLKRDIALSKHIADCKLNYELPVYV